MLSHSGAPINHSPLAIHLFWSTEDILQDSCFPFLIRSRYFEVVISFKSFNSTGAIPPFNQLFNDVSFEWALTHRSFPRILPDSSNPPGAILKFISKFDVRMNYHQSYVFLQDLSNSFHRWLNPLRFSFSRSISTIVMVVLIIILNI